MGRGPAQLTWQSSHRLRAAGLGPLVSCLSQLVTRGAAPEAARRARAASTRGLGARGRGVRSRLPPPPPHRAHRAVNQGRGRWTNGNATRKSACHDQPMRCGVKSNAVSARPMRDSGLTINLSARDSERERVCARARAGRRGRGGWGWGGGRGRARDSAICLGEAQMERDKERPGQGASSCRRLAETEVGITSHPSTRAPIENP